jgi:hypothetical protein
MGHAGPDGVEKTAGSEMRMKDIYHVAFGGTPHIKKGEGMKRFYRLVSEAAMMKTAAMLAF